MDRSPQPLVRQASSTAGIRLACLASLLLLLTATGCAPLARRQAPPQSLAANAGQRTLMDSDLKRFIEQQSRQPVDNWPIRTWDFPKLTLAASYFSLGLLEDATQLPAELIGYASSF